MKKLNSFIAIVFLSGIMFSTAGCFTQRFVVGEGSQTGETVEARHWYVLFGLVSINQPDAEQMADGAEDYTVETKFSLVDTIISVFTGGASVFPRTVKIIK